ncbi:alpha/beta fold hydrolase [candidate division KSB1 bacterium]
MFRKLLIAAMFPLFGACDIDYSKTTFHTAQAPSPEPGTIFIYPERIILRDGGFFNAERGIMFVPINRSDKNSAVIGIEVYRFKASEKAQPGTPPVFFLHGGPSFGGLERPLEEPGTFEERWLPLTDISDVVVVGQRGIGSSKPTTIIETTTAPDPPDRPYDDEKAVAEFQQVLRREKTSWEDSGVDLSGFTIIEAVGDVNDVRKALGYDKITIWGGSFGSHWGMNVMRYHPEIVERAILRGMEGPDHTYDHPGHLWNVYERIAQEVEEAPEFAGLIPEGGLIEAVKTVIRRADDNPFTVTVTSPESGRRYDVLFDGESIRQLSRGYSGGLTGWAADVITMYRGDFRGAAERTVRRYENSGRSFGTASYFMLDCGSGITPERLVEHDSDPATEILGRMNWDYKAGTPVWESDLGNEFRQNFETEIPTVIAHGTWDTSTPYENALELVPFFKNSTFIPVIRGPHGAINAAMSASEEFRSGIMHFAATGDVSQLPEEVVLPLVQWIVPDIR